MEYNASDEKQAKKQQRKERLDRKQELEDIKAILDTPSGLRFFRRFFEEGRIFTTTFTGNSHSFFLEGHRNFALRYFNDICESAPHKVVELMITRADNEKQRAEEDAVAEEREQ